MTRAMKNAVSAVVLTKNEEAMLPGCLESLQWVDEIVVVDSLSTDRTREIAEAVGARFLPHPFENFSSQFNWGIEQAAGPWILMVDADEVIDDTLRGSIQTLLAGEPRHDVYMVIRDAFFLGKRMRSSSWSHEPLPRLFRKGSLIYSGLVHPKTEYGNVALEKLRGRLLHYSDRDLEHFFRKFQSYTTLWAQDAFASGKTVDVSRCVASSVWRFLHSYFLRGEILDGRLGLISSISAMAYTFVKYIKLWDLNRLKKT